MTAITDRHSLFDKSVALHCVHAPPPPTFDCIVVLQAYSGIAAAAREHGLFPAVSMYNENDSMTILGPKNGQHELSYRDTDESKHTVRSALSRVLVFDWYFLLRSACLLGCAPCRPLCCALDIDLCIFC